MTHAALISTNPVDIIIDFGDVSVIPGFDVPGNGHVAGAGIGWSDGTLGYTPGPNDGPGVGPIEPRPETYRIVEVVCNDNPPTSYHSVYSEEFDLDGDVLTITRTYVDPDLDFVKQGLQAEIDHEAGVERTKYITTVPGQEMTYTEKRDEARAFAADPDPDPVNYPLLFAEASHTGSTMQAVAALVTAEYNAWRQIGAAIEGARMGTKANIAAAESIAAAVAAREAVIWP